MLKLFFSLKVELFSLIKHFDKLSVTFEIW